MTVPGHTARPNCELPASHFPITSPVRNMLMPCTVWHPDVAPGALAVSNRATAAKDTGTMDGGASLVGRGRQSILPGLAEALKGPGPRGGRRPALSGVAAE